MAKIVKKNGLMIRSFSEVISFAGEIKQLIDEGHGYDSLAIYKAALDLQDEAKAFVELLEDLDDNIEPGKLDFDADAHFEKPITDYVNARIGYLSGDLNSDTLEKAHKAAVYFQNGKNKNGVKPEKGCNINARIAAVNDHVSYKVLTAMEQIEEAYRDVEHFTSNDVETLRFYLEHLPNNSHYDIEYLSNEGVISAFKKERLLK